MSSEQSQFEDRDAVSESPGHKLMVSGWICPESSCALSVEVRRGMPVFSAGGSEVGKVGAVVLNELHHTATHILLSQLPEVQGYWLVPLSWIKYIRVEEVHLTASKAEIKSLPRWHEASPV